MGSVNVATCDSSTHVIVKSSAPEVFEGPNPFDFRVAPEEFLVNSREFHFRDGKYEATLIQF